MKAIIRREILNYLKRPLFWIAIVVVIFGVFQQLNPYLNIHYITSEEELENEYPEAVREGEIFEGYIPVSTEEHRELWENTHQPVIGLPVQIGKIRPEFFRQKQFVVLAGSVFLQIYLVHPAPPPDGLAFFRQLQVWYVIIADKNIVQTVAVIMDTFF